MKAMNRDNFDAAGVAEELIDGDGAIFLKGVFDKARIDRARELIVAETEADRETGSHFNQSGTDARLQRRVWFTRLVELSPDIARLLTADAIPGGATSWPRSWLNCCITGSRAVGGRLRRATSSRDSIKRSTIILRLSARLPSSRCRTWSSPSTMARIMAASA